MLSKYPKLSEELINEANRHSTSGKRGNNSEATYNGYLKRIGDCSFLSEEQKMSLAERLHSLYSEYFSRSAYFVPCTVSGRANYNFTSAQKKLQSIRNAWEKVEEFLKRYEKVFDPNYKDFYPKNKEKEAIFENHDYKIVNYTLKTGEDRVGFVFTFKIKQQLKYALKSRGFRWNALQGIWGGKPESFENQKEWCLSLSENYKKYIS